MYKCKIGVLFFIYLQILPWNKVALFPPHLQEKQPHKSFTSDIGPVINHQQFFPPIRSHLRLYFTFKLGWNCLQQRYVWEFSFSLISMEIRCRAELHPKGAVLFIYINKSCSSIYIFFFGSANHQSLIIFARFFNTWHLASGHVPPFETRPPSSLWGKIIPVLLVTYEYITLPGLLFRKPFPSRKATALNTAEVLSWIQRLKHESFLNLGWQISTPKGPEKREKTSLSMRMRITTESMTS